LITLHNAAASAGNSRRSAETFITHFVCYTRGEALLNLLPE